MKPLIVYYSRTGKTELVAKALEKNLSGDVKKVVDLKNRNGIIGYLSAGLDSIKQNFTKIEDVDVDLSEYNPIYLGTPIWVGKSTPAINTFISKFDFKDKEVIPFATMGGEDDKRAIGMMSIAVEAKGGKVIDSFGIKTSKVPDERIKKITDFMCLRFRKDL